MNPRILCPPGGACSSGTSNRIKFLEAVAQTSSSSVSEVESYLCIKARISFKHTNLYCIRKVFKTDASSLTDGRLALLTAIPHTRRAFLYEGCRSYTKQLMVLMANRPELQVYGPDMQRRPQSFTSPNPNHSDARAQTLHPETLKGPTPPIMTVYLSRRSPKTTF